MNSHCIKHLASYPGSCSFTPRTQAFPMPGKEPGYEAIEHHLYVLCVLLVNNLQKLHAFNLPSILFLLLLFHFGSFPEHFDTQSFGSSWLHIDTF